LSPDVIRQISLSLSSGGLGLANLVAQSHLIFQAAHREMISAFKGLSLITSACTALENQSTNPLTTQLSIGYTQLANLNSTEAASHTPLHYRLPTNFKPHTPNYSPQASEMTS
jgi:hypothetical protein